MKSSRLSPPPLRLALGVLLGAAAVSGFAAESTPPAKPPATSTGWDLPEFIDHLPDFLSERLPGFEPTGAVRVYVRPHFGDLLHRDYLRLPVGARAQVSDNIEVSTELESYFTHGLGDAAGYGLSRLQLGVKSEHVLPALDHGGISVGLNYQTPLSRPPVDLTDGYRHFQPYIAATHSLVPAWHLLGFAGVSGDFLDRTAIPANFGRNQLHANSLAFGAGAAREWPRFRASLTASVTTSALTSDEAKQVYALRPEVVLPWNSRRNAQTQVLLTLSGRAIHGPDGNELGVSGSVRIEFKLNRAAK